MLFLSVLPQKSALEQPNMWFEDHDIFAQFYFVIVVCMYVPVAARRDVTEEANQRRLDSLNNIVTVIIFFIFVTNIFITVFGMERTGLFARMHFWFLICVCVWGSGGWRLVYNI